MTEETLEILDQGLSLLNDISDKEYNTKIQLIYGGTIGGHYRHVLEHFSTLFESYTKGSVNYDLRKRSVEIEKSRELAILATKDLQKKWFNVSSSCFTQELELRGKFSHKVEELKSVNTSLGRELAYSIAHAQHHYAIIGIMCTLLECPVIEGFGVAPSTAKHRENNGEKALATV